VDEISSIPRHNIPASSLSDDFYAAAFRRIVKNMVALTVVLAVAGSLKFGARVGIGFVIGCAIAMANFYGIRRVVTIFAGRVLQQETTKPKGMTFRFLLRYVLVGLILYVIFKSSLASFNALLAGLFLPVPAILLESGYELVVLSRR